MTAPYPYSEGDRLHDRNTYFFSTYHGAGFLEAWHESRRIATTGVEGRRRPAPADPRAPLPALGAPCAAVDLIDALLVRAADGPLERAASRRAQLLLRGFEVSKRIFDSYGPEGRSLKGSGYLNLALYLRFGAVCALQWEAAHPLPYLNALLKVVDSLVASRDLLDASQREELAWLIDRESAWVASVAATSGVEAL